MSRFFDFKMFIVQWFLWNHVINIVSWAILVRLIVFGNISFKIIFRIMVRQV